MQIDPTKRTGAAELFSVPHGTGEKTAEKAEHTASGAYFSIDDSRKLKTVTYGHPANDGEKATAEDIMAQAGNLDAVAMKNEMVVGAKTISSEDAKKLEEEGFSLRDTDVHTVVTVTDKIKATLAASGKDVSKMGGVSDEVLEELAGGSGAMAAIVQGMQAADLPESEETAAAMEVGLDAVSELTAEGTISDGAKAYLIENELEPTLGNIKQAVYVGASQNTEQSGWTDGEKQTAIEGVFARDLIPDSTENKAAAEWLLERELPLTFENIEYKKALDEALIVSPEADEAHNQAAVIHRMIEAAAEGGAPQDAYLAEGFSASERAERAMDVISDVTDDDLAYLIENGEELNIRNLRKAHELNAQDAQAAGTRAAGVDAIELVKARRVLEETRLVMSLEANRSLIRQGMEIDTTELTKLVDDLKTIEKNYYQTMLNVDGEAEAGAVETFKSVLDAAEELKWMPAAALSAEGFDGHTLESLHREGARLQSAYEAAGERYETMATEVRRDLGDSIQKAFRNVDDILDTLGYEKNRENERAVRILGYNAVEVNPENIERMKKADALVQSAFDSLKPAVVREFIKEGINPLSMDMETLKTKAEEIKKTLPVFDETEKFSKYLYRLEQSSEITEEERSSYIGIYRLINQIEKADGAAIGAVVETGRELNMENLLSAVRTARKHEMDYTVDDDFSGVEGTIRGESITDQVMKAFGLMNGGNGGASEQGAQDQEKGDEAYYQQILKDMRHAAEAADDVYEAMKTYEVVPSVDNTIVMENLMTSPDSGLKRFFALDREELSDEEDLFAELERIKAEILDAFGEHVKNPEELQDAMETLASVAEHCTQTYFKEDMTTLDLRQMQLACKQLGMASNLAKDFHYNVPVMTDDGVTNVSFRVMSGEESGTVTVYMESQEYGKLSAKLNVRDGEVKGYIASDSREGADALRRRAEELPGNIDILFSGEVRDQAYALGAAQEGDAADIRDLFDLATDIVKFMRSSD